MKLIPLVVGLVLVAIGLVAIAGGDLCGKLQWIMAAAAAVLGVGGLVSASLRSGRSTHQER